MTITDKEIEDFESHWDDLPDTFSAMVNIIKNEDSGSEKKIVFSGFVII